MPAQTYRVTFYGLAGRIGPASHSVTVTTAHPTAVLRLAEVRAGLNEQDYRSAYAQAL